MEAFKSFKSIGVPIDIINCDTDQIIPARFLSRPSTDPAFGTFLFHDLRFNGDGTEIPDFVYNRAPFCDGQIFVADLNWGCGSSREHAVWALVANGVRAVIAPSFGDIHYNNCMKHGVLPVRLSREECDTLRGHMHEAPGAEIAIDLEAQTVTALNGTTFTFEIAPFDKHRMLNGVDDIGMTLAFSEDIDTFEKKRDGYEWLARESAGGAP